jgi:aryl-alcohol dehydrogenase-like predicted oxidoreductase
VERRRLGGTDLELSVIGLGTWVFGGRWGGAEDADSVAACHASLDAGVNWIDTADVYGQHRAERIVGKVLKERRDDVIVATKCGVAWTTEPSFRIWREASADYIRAAVDRSLQALGIDVIDLYQVHWPVKRVVAEETMGAMLELKEAGKIRAIGVSNYDVDDLAGAGAAGPLDSLQVGYHLMRRDVEAAELPWCAGNAVGVLAYGPLAHGLLTGKMSAGTAFAPGDWRNESELFADDAFPERIAVVEELSRVADEAGRPGGVAELAVAWVLRRREVTAAIVGARDADQARANVRLAGRPLSHDEAAAIDDVLARHPAASRHYGHGEPPDRED